MTANEQKQLRNSLLAIICCVLFLWTGKKFIWNSAGASDHGTESSSSAAESLENNTTPPTTTTTTAPPVVIPQDTTSSAAAAPADTTFTSSTVSASAPETTTTTTTAVTTTTAAQPQAPSSEGFTQAPEGYFSDALFVGDSRTVGMAKYAPLEGAEYFATTGLAAHKVYTAENEVGSSRGLSFAQLLASRKFGKIYVMLGINEIGNNRTVTLQNYQELLNKIRAAQPDAIIIIQANLHVAQSRSATDAVVNNVQINSFNEAISAFADGQTSFYLDVNPIFDDENGALRAECTHDGTHPLAKYYKDWDNFLMEHAIVK